MNFPGNYHMLCSAGGDDFLDMINAGFQQLNAENVEDVNINDSNMVMMPGNGIQINPIEANGANVPEEPIAQQPEQGIGDVVEDAQDAQGEEQAKEGIGQAEVAPHQVAQAGPPNVRLKVGCVTTAKILSIQDEASTIFKPLVVKDVTGCRSFTRTRCSWTIKLSPPENCPMYENFERSKFWRTMIKRIMLNYSNNATQVNVAGWANRNERYYLVSFKHQDCPMKHAKNQNFSFRRGYFLTSEFNNQITIVSAHRELNFFIKCPSYRNKEIARMLITSPKYFFQSLLNAAKSCKIYRIDAISVPPRDSNSEELTS